MGCHCGSPQTFEQCCELYLSSAKIPETAEKLMRSRYTAFALGNVEYLKNTLAPESRSDFDAAATKSWAEKSTWKGLKILSTKKGTENDKTGTVEFIAKYEQDEKVIDHHEVAKFRKSEKGKWYFVDGESHVHKDGEDPHHPVKQTPIVRDSPKVGRNDPCSCGSGQKFKKCCGA